MSMRKRLDRIAERLPARPADTETPTERLTRAFGAWADCEDEDEGRKAFAGALLRYCEEEAEFRGMTEALDPFMVLDSLEHLALLAEAAGR